MKGKKKTGKMGTEKERKKNRKYGEKEGTNKAGKTENSKKF